MTPMLRWLVWLAALIGLWSVALEWEAEIAQLRPEKAKLEQLRQREGAALQSIDWKTQELLARQAQLAWLNRLPEVHQTGLFRAEAMENLSDLCKRLDANCQIASMGETFARSAAPTTLGATASQTSRAHSELQGLVSTGIRLSVGLAGNKLMPLMQEIEEGPVLRKIERFTVRSGRAELIVKVFGLQGEVAQAERTAATRLIEQHNAVQKTDATAPEARAADTASRP